VFVECIYRKLETKIEAIFRPETFRVIGFMDDNVSKIYHLEGGPNETGMDDASRNDHDIQQMFYNGWKKHQDIQWQSVELPNEMTMNLYGSKSFRHGDQE